MLFESVERADDIDVHFGKMFVLKIESNAWGIYGFYIIKEGLTVLFSVVKHSGGG